MAESRDPGKERLLEGRPPTLSGAKTVAGGESVASMEVRTQSLQAKWTPGAGRPATSLPPGAALDGVADAGSVTTDKMAYANHGATRLQDEVRAARSQMASNPVAMPPLAAFQ